MAEESFVSKHKTGWIFAFVSAAIGIIVNGIYESVLAPTQAEIAAGQVEDSMASWVLHHQASYGDVIPNLIIWGTLLVVFLFLLPTITHAIKLAKTD